MPELLWYETSHTTWEHKSSDPFLVAVTGCQIGVAAGVSAVPYETSPGLISLMSPLRANATTKVVHHQGLVTGSRDGTEGWGRGGFTAIGKDGIYIESDRKERPDTVGEGYGQESTPVPPGLYQPSSSHQQVSWGVRWAQVPLGREHGRPRRIREQSGRWLEMPFPFLERAALVWINSKDSPRKPLGGPKSLQPGSLCLEWAWAGVIIHLSRWPLTTA
jgi:hypothetical protein